MIVQHTAQGFIEDLTKLSKQVDYADLSMRVLFETAKKYVDMPLIEIINLLSSPVYRIRLGGVCIMDFQARSKKTPESRKKELFDLYLNHHDSINTWDMVDRAAPYVVGGYLADKPREILYTLAHSKNWYERRTAIVATYYFLRLGEVEDTFKIAEILIHDPVELVQKAVGSWVRAAGDKDKQRLFQFLDSYASTMPRIILRYAIEKLSPVQKKHYMSLKSKKLYTIMTNQNSEEKILTLTPEPGKAGVNILKSRYNIIKEAIISILSAQETMTMLDLSEAVKQQVGASFDGKVGWYFMAVKLDLEARGIIERLPKKSPQTLKMKL